MDDSKLLSLLPALITALGGAKGCILLASTVAASLGTCTYQVSAKNTEIEQTQQQVANVAEAYQQTFVEPPEPEPQIIREVIKCADGCKKYTDSRVNWLLEEFHR